MSLDILLVKYIYFFFLSTLFMTDTEQGIT